MQLLKKWYQNRYESVQLSEKDSEDNNASPSAEMRDIITTTMLIMNSELRNLYLICQYTIVNNISKPSVTLADGHSYVSLRYVISNFLSKVKIAANISVDRISYVSYLEESMISRDVYERDQDMNKGVPSTDIIVLLGVQWSNDFYPNSSINRSRGYIWMEMFTFVSSDSQNNLIEDTYPMMTALKESNHDLVKRNTYKIS